jgi:hypothetical protein
MTHAFARQMEEKDVLQYKRSIEGNIIYEGWAPPSMRTNRRGWMLKRTVLDGMGITESLFAQSKVNFTLVWSAREMYNYEVS